MTKFSPVYFDDAVFDLPGVIEKAKAALKGIDFDTMVGTGFSGGVVIPALALAMGKKFVLVRKENDDSHHGGGRLLGELGERWIFVDDFISSGRTRKYVIKKISDNLVRATGSRTGTTMVGQYMYAKISGEGPAFEHFSPTWIPEELKAPKRASGCTCSLCARIPQEMR